MGKSSDTVSQLLNKINNPSTMLLDSDRTKIDETIERKFVNMSARKSMKSLVKTIDGTREIPSNQQEGDAYDKELEDASDAMKDSNEFENQKLNEIINEENSQAFNDSLKQLNISRKENQFIPKNGNKNDRENSDDDEEAQEFDDRLDDDFTEVKAKGLSNIWNYMKRSSLFIFHESWHFRQILITMVTSTENLTTRTPRLKSKKNEVEVSKKESNSKNSDHNSISEDEYSFDDNLESIGTAVYVYNVSQMQIVDGKIVTTKRKYQISKWFENIIILLVILNS